MKMYPKVSLACLGDNLLLVAALQQFREVASTLSKPAVNCLFFPFGVPVPSGVFTATAVTVKV